MHNNWGGIVRRLAVRAQRAIVAGMTAYEVIDQIKALPLPERAKVMDFVHELETKEPPARTLEPRAFDQAARQVFDRHEKLMRKLSQ